MKFNLSIPFRDPSRNRISQTEDQISPGIDDAAALAVPALGANLEILTPVQIDANPEPYKQRVNNPTRRGLIPAAVRAARQLLGAKKLLPEEIALLEEEQQRKLQEKVLYEESKVCVQRIVKCLTRLDICYVPRRDGKTDPWRNGPRRVRVAYVAAEPDSIWFKIDSENLPHGVSIEQLTTQEVLNNLMYALGHKVSVQSSETAGVWYIMERASGSLGLPTHVMYRDMLERMPASADGLTIPIGMGQNSKPIYASLSRMCHMLVGGSTNSGKSNFLNVMLCTLIRNNPPDRLQLMLIDLKNGLEFSHYEGVPHLLAVGPVVIGHDDGEDIVFTTNGIVYDLEDVPEALLWIAREADRRFTLMREARAKNIGEYNARRRKNALSHIVVVIDEYANIRYSQYGKAAEQALSRGAALWRAIGIHLVVCTQIPKTEVVTNIIKANLPAKIAFYCTNNAASMTLVDNSSAHAMGNVPGRLVFQFDREVLGQAPLINSDIIAGTVEGAQRGEYGTLSAEHDVTILEVLTWALDQNSGWLENRTLWGKFRDRGLPKAALEKWLREAEQNEFVIGSTVYRVEPGDNNHGRRVVPVEQHDTEPSEQDTTEAAEV